MLHVDRTVRADVAGAPQRCVVLLADVEGWPRWARLVRDVERTGEELVMRAEVLGLTVEMRCVLERAGDGAVLRRLPNEPTDEERFTAAFTVGPAGAGAAVTLHVAAAIDLPGAAGLLRGRIERRLADELLADFARAVAEDAG